MTLPDDTLVPDSSVNLLLLLILRIHKVGSHGNQLVRLSPLPHTSILLTRAPMLSVLRHGQVQRLRRTVLRREHEKDIAMLAGLGWRARRLVLDHIVRTTSFLDVLLDETMLRKREDGEGSWSYRDVGGNPMAHFAPFGVVAGRCIGICERDDVGWVFVGRATGACVFIQSD